MESIFFLTLLYTPASHRQSLISPTSPNDENVAEMTLSAPCAQSRIPVCCFNASCKVQLSNSEEQHELHRYFEDFTVLEVIIPVVNGTVGHDARSESQVYIVEWINSLFLVLKHMKWKLKLAAFLDVKVSFITEEQTRRVVVLVLQVKMNRLNKRFEIFLMEF